MFVFKVTGVDGTVAAVTAECIAPSDEDDESADSDDDDVL
jgi:hypothetical protein